MALKFDFLGGIFKSFFGSNYFLSILVNFFPVRKDSANRIDEFLHYVPNIFLELSQKFESNWSSNKFDTTKSQNKKKKEKRNKKGLHINK